MISVEIFVILVLMYVMTCKIDTIVYIMCLISLWPIQYHGQLVDIDKMINDKMYELPINDNIW